MKDGFNNNLTLYVFNLEQRGKDRELLSWGEGVLGFGLGGGVRLTPQNPYPYLGVILAENGTRFKGFYTENPD